MSKEFSKINFINPYESKKGTPEYCCAESILNALISYLVLYRPVEEQSEECVYILLLAYDTELELLFQDVQKNIPLSIAFEYYKIFKMFPRALQQTVVAMIMYANFNVRIKTINNEKTRP